MNAPAVRTISLAVVILAAGQSSRMGRPKMLLPWGKTTVLGRLIELWTELPVRQIAVVIAGSDAGIVAELDRLAFRAGNWIANPEPKRGMFSSIQCAARWQGWQASLTHWAVVLGDQPHIELATLSALKSFVAQHPTKICQPARNGHGRHPVILPKNEFEKLAHFENGTLKDFLQARSTELRLVEVNDPGLDLEMNSPKEYEAAWELFSKKQV